jgi:hypothetical protein
MTIEVSQLAALSLARYEFRLRAESETVLHSLLGSALRGAFGHSWKTIVCAAPPGERAECFLREVCLRPVECGYSFFKAQAGGSAEPQAGTARRPKPGEMPRPYIFEPPTPPLTREISSGATLKMRVPRGGVLPFRLTLLGEEGQGELANVVAAVALMSKRGLGVTRAPFALERVTALDEDERHMTVFEPRSGGFVRCPTMARELDALVGRRLSGLRVVDTLTVQFLTPTRLRADGRVRRHLSFADLIGYVSRRLRLLASFYGSRPLSFDHEAMLACADGVTCVDVNLWHHRADRYSESRREKLEHGGLLGEMTFRGSQVQSYLPLLVAGEFLHVGSSTSFGMGCYRVVA